MPSIVAALGTASSSGSPSKMLLSNCFTSFAVNRMTVCESAATAIEELCVAKVLDQMPPSDCQDDLRCYPSPRNGLPSMHYVVGIFAHGLNVC